MKYLLTSIFFSALFSCASYVKGNQLEPELYLDLSHFKNSYFSNKDKAYTYRSNIEVYSKSLTGLLIIKKIDDANHRVVFTTEMGNTIFDFSYIGDQFKVNSIVKDLDKFFIVNILKNDFWVLVKEHPEFTKAFKKDDISVVKGHCNKKDYFYYFKDQVLQKIVRVGNSKEKMVVSFNELTDSVANTIKIKHNNIQLDISLKQF